ncbi:MULTISPECIES: SDR family NAD(P)-dependent oxidoreductase [unclassified Paenibacillus]|uniref:SDR family oxidoreductase n=1 Tax=unclassified Paenibacillus TaxID=185978 RepID=UPI0009571229|nr:MULTISPECIES: SDR family NAD(P)-dependent oxidoreductase [unclassified Paenibacillus]ASS65566.1 SDR family oxidoreductase [Paenibacillus sp. RUD330]SIQ31732.1 NAD(P)-dependent dehydrogenase, short-chain alcohol dehydrogenase family [Paenibacillus sp. RU4X]SIQ53387.1 NAD(P)-dependent dehydrogenase, short-chain alcohol dehydrogenase family [Paenibacillus sp. RU4T]
MTVSRLLEGKVAIVTGGGSGIGRAAALDFARHGAKVGFLDRTPDDAEKVRDEIQREGGEAIVTATDVSDAAAVEAGIRSVYERFGRIDVVFANAGINGVWTTIEDLDVDDWDETLGINLRGTFLTVKYSIPHLKKNGGSIIITSSINGNRIFNNTGASAYSSSKAGQVAFMKMAALELAPHKIRVNAVCPGAIKTHIDDSTIKTKEAEEAAIPVEYPEGSHPLAGKPGRAAQVADLVTYLASDLSSHVTGTDIYVDGAESLL